MAPFPPLTASAEGPPSPELFRLLNAAAMDALFRAELIAAPERAAGSAASVPGTAFGCALPDQALRLEPVQLTENDRSLLRSIPPVTSLPELCRQLAAVAPLAAAGAMTAAPPAAGPYRANRATADAVPAWDVEWDAPADAPADASGHARKDAGWDAIPQAAFRGFCDELSAAG